MQWSWEGSVCCTSTRRSYRWLVRYFLQRTWGSGVSHLDRVQGSFSSPSCASRHYFHDEEGVSQPKTRVNVSEWVHQHVCTRGCWHWREEIGVFLGWISLWNASLVKHPWLPKFLAFGKQGTSIGRQMSYDRWRSQEKNGLPRITLR